MDGSKCISYFTIELKDELPNNMKGKFDNWMFGCDICQEVCPWNDKSLQNISDLPKSKLVGFFNRNLEIIYQEIENMSNKQYKTFFRHTSFERVGKKGLLKNLKYYLKT